MAVALADPGVFESGRDFAVFLGLVPGHTGSGRKTIVFGITKRGDRSIRTLLINGAMSTLRQRHQPDFFMSLIKKGKPKKVIIVALAA
ncbi:MAG TPA: IS110 family transposase [Candidatus Aphodousia faecipullorum]|nr:IS110 family transposase [Candidatus Aphodousia faecipullorum]